MSRAFLQARGCCKEGAELAAWLLWGDTVTLILSGSCVFWQRGMNEEPCPEAGTLQGIKTGREVTGAVTHRCLVKEG